VQKFGLTALFPLWKKNTMVLLRDFIAAGFETLLCCVNSTYLGEEWLGNKIDQTFLDRLPLNVDPCGENGEFHTFCYAGPVFKSPVNYTTGKTEYKSLNVKTPEQEIEYGFWYLDLY
jgi:diphthamide synthase (EF-2-diphthine--ammonia ligase)